MSAANWRFDFKDYVAYYINALESNKTSKSFQIQSKKPSISIWGSCISRELLNYTNEIDINCYLLQNSIQTLFFEPFEIDESDIKSTANFVKRMFLLESRKKTREYFSDRQADYLLLDTFECKSSFWMLKSNHNVRIGDSATASQTIKGSKYETLFDLVESFSITEEEWEKYIDQFVEFVLSYYPMERIILNDFRFAEYYMRDGKFDRYPIADLYIRYGKITNHVAERLKSKLPRMKIITPESNTIGDYYHHIGCHPSHFLDEIYMRQAKKLEEIVFA